MVFLTRYPKALTAHDVILANYMFSEIIFVLKSTKKKNKTIKLISCIQAAPVRKSPVWDLQFVV